MSAFGLNGLNLHPPVFCLGLLHLTEGIFFGFVQVSVDLELSVWAFDGPRTSKSARAPHGCQRRDIMADLRVKSGVLGLLPISQATIGWCRRSPSSPIAT